MPRVYAVLITHTPRHLRRSLLGIAAQSRRPDATIVSCDGDQDELAAVVAGCSAEFAVPLTIVRRAHTGSSRSSQVRNNAVRALRDHGPRSEDRIVFFDGDCCPAAGAVGAHEALGGERDLVIGFRIELSEAQTERFDEEAVRRGEPPAPLEPAQMALLEDRQRRYERQRFLRRIGLTKPHKPKVLSANFSVSWGLYEKINGFDEEFIGWGGEDDDFSRRIYQAGGRPVVAITRAVVYHQYHPTRAPASWRQAPGVGRFKQRLPMRCARGLDNPLEQPAVRVTSFGGGPALSSAAAAAL